MFDLGRLRKTLNEHNPNLLEKAGLSPAAVALILQQGKQGLEILFIERAPHPADPWSGNLAFPGGRIDPDDLTARAAAERETLEEIGLDLSRAELLGRLDDIIGAYLPVKISCFVYLLTSSATPVLNHEVTRTFWFPLQELCQPSRHTLSEIYWHGRQRRIHGIRLDDDSPLLWGITYRLAVQFLRHLEAIDPALLRVEDD